VSQAVQSAAPSLEEATAFLREHQSFAVMSHVNPDADAIGSSLGLALGLRALGKDVVVVLSDRVPEYARFLAGAEEITNSLPTSGIDALICADAAGIDRIGTVYAENGDLFGRLPVLNVDHHRTNPLYGTVNYVDGAASSTSELSYRLLTELQAPIEPAAANAMMFGIVGDTGSFRNGATTPGSLETTGRLVELGADTQQIAFQLFEAKRFAAARLWGRIVSTIELDAERQIVFACLTQEMLQSEGATVDETEGVAEYLRGIEEAEVVMMVRENGDDTVRVSMRSRPAVDVSIIASAFNGGGHRQAAGCTIPGTLTDARNALVAAYDRLSRQP
jgi:phosphoesterase RecJ-like protein